MTRPPDSPSARCHLRVLAASAITLLLSACGGDVADRAGPGDLGHIHDLVETTDGDLLVASHRGLFRIADIETAVRVGIGRHDLMSLTSVADGTLLASGHPDLRFDEFRAEDLPPHLGLASSVDLGETWTVDPDLLGELDFHALEPTERGVYAAATDGVIRVLDSDGAWHDLGSLAARDLAAHPDDAERLIATDDDAQIWVSSDGARTWVPAATAPRAHEVEWVRPDLLISADDDGALHRATDPFGPWTSIGDAPVEVETLHTAGGRWWVTAHGGAIHLSTDGATTWNLVYLPPER